jgi:hypothetical protein
MEYCASYDSITALGDELPLNEELSFAIDLWLTWKGWERTSNLSYEASYFKAQWDGEINKLAEENLKTRGKNSVQGRVLAGFAARRDGRIHNRGF